MIDDDDAADRAFEEKCRQRIVELKAGGVLEGVRLLWHVAYYDGPLTGVAEYRGKRYWFRALNEESREEWVYDLIELPAGVMAEEERRHELFREYVGVHTDYDERGKRSQWVPVPGRDATVYYEELKTWPWTDYDRYPVVGRFVR